MSTILSVDSVSKYFTSEPVLDRVSFDIDSSEHIALIGPNGAGKTTLLKLLMNEIDPDRGSVQLAKSATVGVLKQRHDLPQQQNIWQAAQQAMEPVLRLIQNADKIASEIADTADSEDLNHVPMPVLLDTKEQVDQGRMSSDCGDLR